MIPFRRQSGTATNADIAPTTTPPSPIHFSQLVRPSSMRSRYWKFFGFPAGADGQILSRCRIVCTLCRMAVAYNRNTTNLITHLRNRHPSIIESDMPPLQRPLKYLYKPLEETPNALNDDAYDDIEDDFTVTDEVNQEPKDIANNEKDDDNKSVVEEDDPEIKGYTVEYVHFVEDAEQQPNNSEHPEQNQPTSSEIIAVADEIIIDKQNCVDDLLVNVFIENMLPVSIVESSALSAFCTSLNSTYRLPDVETIESSLNYRYSQRKADLSNAFHAHLNSTEPKERRFFSIGIDRFTNRCNDSTFITVYAFYIANIAADDLETIMLATLRWEHTQTTDVWATLFRDMPLELCTAAVLNFKPDQHVIMQAFFETFCPEKPLFYCLHHAIGDAARVCLETENMRYIFETIRDMEEATVGIAGIVESRSCWQAKYEYLHSVQNRLLLTSRGDKETPTLNDANLIDELAALVAEVLQLLDPLRMAQRAINAERTPCASLVHPIVQELLQNHFAAGDSISSNSSCSNIADEEKVAEIMDDADEGSSAADKTATESVAEHMKAIVRNTFAERGLVFNVHSMAASLLDPRFQNLIDGQRDLPAVRQQLRKLLVSDGNGSDMTDSLAAGTTTPSTSVTSSSASSSSSRLSSFLQRKTKNGKRSLLRRSLLDIELDAYVANVDADLEECPLAWWRNVGAAEYGQLGQCTYRYLCVPAVLPSGRLTGEQRMRADAQRMAFIGDERQFERAVWLQEDLRQQNRTADV